MRSSGRPRGEGAALARVSVGALARGAQLACAMAAVFALVFIPALAAIGAMARSSSSLSFGTVLALACFVAMVSGVFYGSLRVVLKAEEA